MKEKPRCTVKCPGWDEEEETCWMGTIGYHDNGICHLSDQRLSERIEELASELIALKLVLRFRKTKKWAGLQATSNS